MLSNQKRFCVVVMPLHDAAIKMIESTWCGCTAFQTNDQTQDVLFLADGSSGEWAVCVRDGEDWRQVESYTVRWMKTPERVAECIAETLASVSADRRPMSELLRGIVLEQPGQHANCWACA